MLSSQEKYADASALANDYVTRQKAILGSEHPKTLNGQSELLEILIHQNQLGQAKILIDELIETATEVKGSNDFDTLQYQMQLGLLYDKMGLFNEAASIEKKTLEASQEIWGPEHPSSIRLSINLAHSMVSIGEFEKAETLLNKVLPLAVAAIGPDHNLVFDILGAMSTLYEEQGRSRESAECCLQRLRISQEKFGNSHFLTLRAIEELASTYIQDDTKLDEAKDLLEDLITQQM